MTCAAGPAPVGLQRLHGRVMTCVPEGECLWQLQQSFLLISFPSAGRIARNK
jgi:hypothetical protein